MTKKMRFALVLVAMMCMFALFASSAFAYSGFWSSCEACHNKTNITVTPTAGVNNGTTAAYTFTAPGATEWAVFAGVTKVASGTGAAGSFSVPAGTAYDIYAVAGNPTAGSAGKTFVSVPSTVIDGINFSADTVAPVSTSNAAAAYNNQAVITINATDDMTHGVEYIYFSVNGGAARATPVGTSGFATAVIKRSATGTGNYTLEFWSQDRAGNIEDPEKQAAFTITTAAAGGGSVTPRTTLGTNGMSQWTYQDLADANAKYEGGYAAYGAAGGYYADPHGGYDTATNKCKVCHAVHRAEGAYYLLRADSQDDACDYCHIGGSAHSTKVVYDLNSGGKATSNGHTIGASTYIPDSSVAQWTQAVTLQTVDADGDPLSEDIEVRAYDEQKNDMYRFARHHGHSAATGGARRNYVPVGPLALRCMSCHQVHNAEAQTWQSVAMANLGSAGQYLSTGTSSYKLLKQFPSGTYVGGLDAYDQVPVGNISLVPETTLTAGVNFDAVRTMGADPTALSLARDFNNDGDMVDAGETVEMNKPMWVAQGFDGEHDRTENLAEEAIASAVNNAALSVWCADCHNLNIGGWEHLANEELGFKAHTERTHPAPFTGSHSGPGQCYSCHRNDLPRINTGDSCSQCHYGTGNYKENRTAGVEYVASDFPHSGEDNDYKMLGSYSIVRTDLSVNTTIDDGVSVGPNNLDAVCIRCHGGIGTFH